MPTARQHIYRSEIIWTGNTGTGNATYKGYQRTWNVAIPGKPVIRCSNDPLLGGDPTLMNPEDMLLSSLSACHMLWYLHLACNEGIIVLSYEDRPEGKGETLPSGAGRFLEATLKPHIRVKAGADLSRAEALHKDVHNYCFISRSINFPVTYEPVFETA